MPRECGREPFFTYLPRERNEGFGNVQALVVKAGYDFAKAGLKTSVQAGHFQLPDVKNLVLNKYGMPAYQQVNAEFSYNPSFMPHLNLQVVFVYKAGRGNAYGKAGYIFNKVDMSNYSLVLNYDW